MHCWLIDTNNLFYSKKSSKNVAPELPITTSCETAPSVALAKLVSDADPARPANADSGIEAMP